MSDYLFDVADTMGRAMAHAEFEKRAAFDKEEVLESVEEAKERESIGGRARSWGHLGAAAGGAGGGAAGGALGMLGNKAIGALRGKPLGGAGRFIAPIAGAAAGAIGGGLFGRGMGQQHGAEEAAADQVVSALRMRNAILQDRMARGGY